MAQGSREMLAQAIRGKSEAEISEFVDAMGGEEFLDVTFEGMAEALRPDKAQDCVIGYELTHRGRTIPYALSVRGGKAGFERRPPTDANVTLALSVPNYLRLITGQLPVLRSVFMRRLRIRGDRKLARRLQEMFS
ncbi:MAG: SCP2 sterol-binding domain-containing protein [Actinomycetota bacterium]